MAPNHVTSGASFVTFGCNLDVTSGCFGGEQTTHGGKKKNFLADDAKSSAKPKLPLEKGDGHRGTRLPVFRETATSRPKQCLGLAKTIRTKDSRSGTQSLFPAPVLFRTSDNNKAPRFLSAASLRRDRQHANVWWCRQPLRATAALPSPFTPL